MRVKKAQYEMYGMKDFNIATLNIRAELRDEVKRLRGER